MISNLRDELPLELVTFSMQYAMHCTPTRIMNDDISVWDGLGLLCIMNTSFQHPSDPAESIFDHTDGMARVNLFCLVYSYRICTGPGVPVTREMGQPVSYRTEAGHWVRTVIL